MLSKLLGYDARLGDKDAEILRLVEENRELRDRLFLKHQLPLSSQDLSIASKGESLPGYTTKRQRLKNYIASTQPPIAAPLSEDDMKALRAAAQ